VNAVRHVVRAAAYRPAWAEGGRRVEGPDEDRFTLMAAALEAAVEGDRAPDRTLALRVLGPDPSPKGGFAALLGRPVETVPGSDPAEPLGPTLSEARAGEGPAVVLAAGSVTSADPGDSSVEPGAASVAFFLDDGTRSAPGEETALGAISHLTAPIDAAFAGWRFARGAPPGPLWVGDWNGRARTPRPAPAPNANEASTARVSQGAYLPPARYLESLPSRWAFLADHCASCGHVTFPRSSRCRSCGRADALSTLRLPKQGGQVVARTWIGPGGQPTEFDPEVERSGAYGVVLVELAPGVRATLMVADAPPGSVQVGSLVATHPRRLSALEGEWRYGRKAVPEVVRPAPASAPASPPSGL
jgi:uncharacterized OB-fold protein